MVDEQKGFSGTNDKEYRVVGVIRIDYKMCRKLQLSAIYVYMINYRKVILNLSFYPMRKNKAFIFLISSSGNKQILL